MPGQATALNLIAAPSRLVITFQRIGWIVLCGRNSMANPNDLARHRPQLNVNTGLEGGNSPAHGVGAAAESAFVYGGIVRAARRCARVQLCTPARLRTAGAGTR